jgi:hypothetical protein
MANPCPDLRSQTRSNLGFQIAGLRPWTTFALRSTAANQSLPASSIPCFHFHQLILESLLF